MKHYEIFKLLNDSTVSKFVTKKLVGVNDLPSGQYSMNKNIRFKNSMLRSDLCDYSDAYIVVKETVTVTDTDNDNKRNKKLVYKNNKNNASSRSSISKINNRSIDNAEDLDIFMPMYNLLKYSDNYSMTSGSLWNCYRDGINDDENENDANKNMVNHNKTTTSKSFKYKTKITGSTANNGNRLNAEIVVSLKYISNFWRFAIG